MKPTQIVERGSRKDERMAELAPIRSDRGPGSIREPLPGDEIDDLASDPRLIAEEQHQALTITRGIQPGQQ